MIILGILAQIHFMSKLETNLFIKELMKIKSKNFINSTGNIFQEFNISTSEYWNALWKKYSDKDIKDLKKINQSKNDLVVRLSKKYLRTNASIIEAGCGLGQEVFKLENAGFNVTDR